MSFRGTFKPGDLLVLAGIALVTWFWSAAENSRRGGEPVKLRVVSALGEDTLSLASDTVFSRGAVTVEIRNGEAAITSSDCPTRQCVRTGWLSGTGEISACMPNGVFIEILGEGPGTDAVSY